MTEYREKKRKRVVRSCRECLRRKQKCDHAQPACSNCVARNVEESCIYSEQNETSRDNPLLHSESIDKPEFTEPLAIEPSECNDDFDMGAFGYSRTNENSTLAEFKKLQILRKDLFLGDLEKNTSRISEHRVSFAARYCNLVKQLPSETYRQYLTQIFFDEVNFVYCILDFSIFQHQLQEWQQIGGSALISNDSDKMTLDMLYFPALIFQVLALALLSLPLALDVDLEPLKRGKSINMLSAEFSQFGCELMSLLSREDSCLTAIQHDILRASWLKTAGFVPQAWHILSQAIRQAQEIGLHEARPKFNDGGTLKENLHQVWLCEYHRRLWCNLYIWDSQMAMMLGRPMTIDTDSCKSVSPIHCHIPKDFLEKPPVPLGDDELPSAFHARILDYNLSLKIAKMRELRAHRPFPKDPTVIQSLHQEAVSLLDSLPAYFRQENPDTTWDIQCPFIPIQREQLICSHLSFILGLHRAHVSTLSNSRVEATKAATGILASQHRLFRYLKPQHYKMHGVMFFTFDASVQLATILLSQPQSESSTVQSALTCLGQGINRLELLSLYSALAKSALVVVRALYHRLQQESNKTQTSISEQGIRQDDLNVEFLEGDIARNLPPDNSMFSFDPRLASYDSFDANMLEDMFNMPYGEPMVDMGNTSLDNSNLEIPDELA